MQEIMSNIPLAAAVGVAIAIPIWLAIVGMMKPGHPGTRSHEMAERVACLQAARDRSVTANGEHHPMTRAWDLAIARHQKGE